MGTLVIVVHDVNDNIPIFDEDTFDTRVSEDSPVGTVFGRVTASDRDDGSNGQLRLSLFKCENHCFVINMISIINNYFLLIIVF